MRIVTGLAISWILFAASAQAQSAADCASAGRAAEREFGLPPGLLLAIGHVESGRWDPMRGRVVAWPWSIDVDGIGQSFDSETAAIAATQQKLANNAHRIDVGCFQIDLHYHPDAFASLQQAFDPQNNARYAAQFLADLQLRLGDWQAAVAAYHSARPALGAPYSRQVFSAWLDAPPTGNPIAGYSGFPGVQVWGPSTATPHIVSVHATLPRTLPRVITPGG